MTLFERLLEFFTARRMTIAEESMLPTLRPGDGVLFSRRALRDGGPRRGDIVLLHPPDDSGRLDVKRVVGLPGEAVGINGMVVEVNGTVLDEPYLADWARGDPGSPAIEFHLGTDEFAVLSDNRVHPGAVDSRKYGPLKRGRIVGAMGRRFQSSCR